MDSSHISTFKRKKILIIGAGPTALGAVHRLYQLRDAGCITENDFIIQILEQETEAGGLARSITDSNGFTWDLGIHVTGTSKYAEFVRILDETIPKWNSIKRCVKADMCHVLTNEDIRTNITTNICSSSKSQTIDNSYNRGNFYVPYPVQNSIQHFGVELQQKCIRELNKIAYREKFPPTVNEETNASMNFAEFSKRIFGKTLQNAFIRPYNEKVWTVKLEEMSSSWVEGRVPRIDYDLLRRRCAQSKSNFSIILAQKGNDDDNDFQSHQQIYFRYPADCKGIGEIWRRLAKKFDNCEIFKFQQKVVKIDTEKKQVWTICQKKNNNSNQVMQNAYSYDVLISTIAITELGKLMSLKNPIALRHSKVILVGIGLRLPQNELTKELSWAYYPQPDTIFYRCTILSNFSAQLTPDPKKFWSVLCEIGTSPESEVDEKLIIEKTIQALVSVGIVDKVEQVYSSWLHVLPYGYPIPTVNRDQVLYEIHSKLHQLGIYSRGRFGGWRYEISNQDHSFECGIQLIDRIFLNVKETLYQCPN